MEVSVKSIGFPLGKITTETPKRYREFMISVAGDAYREVKQAQPNFKPTLLVDGRVGKDPMKVKLDGTLTLLDDIPDISYILKDAEALFYQHAPMGATGHYRDSLRWMIKGQIAKAPVRANADTDNAVMLNISAYSRRGEFGKKETNIISAKVRRSRRKLRLVKKSKKRWFKGLPEGMLLYVYNLLRKKYANELRAKKIYITFKKFKGVAGEGNLDSYPGISIGRRK